MINADFRIFLRESCVFLLRNISGEIAPFMKFSLYFVQINMIYFYFVSIFQRLYESLEMPQILIILSTISKCCSLYWYSFFQLTIVSDSVYKYCCSVKSY